MSQTGYVALLRGNRQFRLLFGARLVSLFGDWFNLLALVAMLRAFGDDSASSVAGVMLLKTLPAVVMSPMAGILADRFARRHVMIAADIARAVCVAGMLALVLYPSLPLLYLLIAAQTATGTFFEPARSALLPELVKPGELTAANALGAAAWSSMLALGSAAGGWFADHVGFEAALAVDAGTYLVSAVLVWLITEPAWTPTRPAATGLAQLLGWTELRDGLRWLWERPHASTMALVKTGWTLGGSTSLILTVLAERVYVAPGAAAMTAVATLFVARGVGTGLGPFVARALSRSEPGAMERLMLPGFLLGLVYVLVPWAPWLWLAVVGVAVAHIGGATVWVLSSIRLQQLTPTAVRGRVFATERMLFEVVAAASLAAHAALFDWTSLDPRVVVTIAGASFGLPALAWAWRLRHYGTQPTSAPGVPRSPSP